MNIEILRNAGIDYDGAVRRFMGRPQLYIKTLSKFSKNDTMERVRADYAAHDLDALERDSHELKGMCGNMSMTRLAGTADRIVSLLRAGGVSEEELAAAMGELEKEYAAIRKAVLTVMEAAE